MLIDIGLPVPAFLPHSSIPESVPLEVSSVDVGARVGGEEYVCVLPCLPVSYLSQTSYFQKREG